MGGGNGARMVVRGDDGSGFLKIGGVAEVVKVI